MSSWGVKAYWDLREVKVLSLLHLISTQNCLWSQALILDIIIDVKQNQMSWPIMSSSTVLLLLLLLWLVNTCTIYWWSVNFENIKVLNAIINFFLYNVFVCNLHILYKCISNYKNLAPDKITLYTEIETQKVDLHIFFTCFTHNNIPV